MNRESIKKFLEENRGYLKWGKRKLARKFKVTAQLITEIKHEINSVSLNKKGFRRLIFDIETSPNIGWFWKSTWNTNIGTNQIIEERKVICISYKWENEDKVYNLVWDENKNDESILREFSKIAYQADELVAHNGDRFDIPWLRTRCLFYNIPFPTYIKTLDTLKKVKSMFNFQSNRLDYIAKFLGLGGKIEISPEVWKSVVFTPTNTKEYKDAIYEMTTYCNYDVVLLEDVFHKIENYIKPVNHVGVHLGNESWSCPMCGSTNVKYLKATTTANGTIKRHMICLDNNLDYVISNTTFKKYLENGN